MRTTIDKAGRVVIPAAIRERERVSQAVFAAFLNVRTKLVSEWERGEKKPSGPSLKLLSLIKTKGLEAIA